MHKFFTTQNSPQQPSSSWRRLLLLTGFLLGFHLIYSQVSGTIKDQEGASMVGVTVAVKGTASGTVSDADGKFRLNVPPGQNTLVFTYTGYETQEVAIDGRSSINVTMSEATTSVNEVIVVAYGTQKKETLTGAVSAVKGVDLIKSPAVDLSNSLAGRLPGVVVIQQSGEPGYDGATINIRGINTLGNSSPLIVIDGIPDRDGGLGRLSPQDIESISVLKDASAAIYGARAANGAILITTKRGKSGVPTLSYSFNQGWSQPTVVPKMSDAVEYAKIMNELPIYRTIPVDEWGAAWSSIQSNGTYDSPTDGVATLSANYSPEAVRKFGDGSDPWRYPNTDWFGDAFRKWAPQSRHNVQLSGGNDRAKYMTSLGYIFQDAIYNNSATYYKQYNMRTNIDVKINNYISTNVGAMVRREDRNFPTESSGAIFRMLMRGRPGEPEVWPNGKPGPDIENGQNPYVVTTNATGYVKDPTDYIQLNGGVDITNPWIDGLKLTLSAAIDRNNRVQKVWQTPWELYSWDKVTFEADGVTPKLVGAVRSNFTDPRLSQAYSSVLNTNLSSLLSYNKKVGDHELGALAGVTKEQFKGDFFFAFRRNFISPAVDQLFAGGTSQQNVGGSAYERARLGYYGRFQYGYKSTYLAEFIWRYDGSYIFPKATRFGFFPGILAGWNVSNEPFFNKNGFVNFLKVRASYGQMGNDQVFYNGRLQEYAYLSTYTFGSYPINGQVVNTLGEAVLANPNFTWERAANSNIGIDASFFKSRIDLTVELFSNKRDQILIQKTGSTPASSGISSLLPPVNAGKVNNKGFEFSLAYNSPASSMWHFRAGVNGGVAKNQVIFMDEVPGAPDYQRQEGKSIGGYLVYQADGAFKDKAAIEANTIDYSGVTGQLIPGDLRIKDYNGDGKIDADDQVRINDNGFPTFNFGANMSLTYGNFDLSALLQGATGASIRISTESGDIGNFLQYSNDHRWSVDNPSSQYPRLASRGDTYYTGGNFGNNTAFLFSKDYIRLKNIELGYTFGNGILDKVHAGGFRVYVNALNLYTIAANKIFDPEATAGSGVYYPQSRVINAGFSLTF